MQGQRSDHKIVADAVLLRGMARARAYTAEARITIVPTFQRRGLSLALLEEICCIAEEATLDSVTLNVIPEHQDELLRAARRLGAMPDI